MLRSIFSGNMSFEMIVISLFSVAVIIFICFPIHECAHALAAKALGDDTAEREGRLTLNPFSHIDWFGAIAMAFCGIGWAKPTPVDLRKCRKTSIRTANFIVSIAGPVSNLLLAMIFMIIYKLILVTYLNKASVTGDMSNFDTVYYVVLALGHVASTNVVLAVFNLLPIPPFDGYRALSSFLPAKWVYNIEIHAQAINIVVMILLISGVLSIPISLLDNLVFGLLDLATSFIA